MSTVVTINGEDVFEDVDWEENMFTSKDRYHGDPDEEDFGGYTGNEGCEATHFYRKSWIILVPESAYCWFMAEFSEDVDFDYSSDLCNVSLEYSENRSAGDLDEIQRFKKTLSRNIAVLENLSKPWEIYDLEKLKERLLSDLLGCAVALQNQGAFVRTLEAMELANISWEDEHTEHVITGLKSLGIKKNMAALDSLWSNRSSTNKNFAQEVSDLEELITDLTTPSISASDRHTLKKWRRKELQELLKDCPLGPGGVDRSLSIAQEISDDTFATMQGLNQHSYMAHAYIFRLLPRALKTEQNIAFLIELTVQLFRRQYAELDSDGMNLINIIRKRITFESFPAYGLVYGTPTSSFAEYIFIQALLSDNDFSSSSEHLLKIITAARTIDTRALFSPLRLTKQLHRQHRSWVKVAESFTVGAADGSSKVEADIDGILKHFAKKIVEIFIRRLLVPKPFRPLTAERALLSRLCCVECSSVNRFLADPNEKDKEYRFPQEERLHIASKLQSIKDIKVDLTETTALKIYKASGRYDQELSKFGKQYQYVQQTIVAEISENARLAYFSTKSVTDILNLPELKRIWNPTPEQAAEYLQSGNAPTEHRAALAEIVNAGKRAARRTANSAGTKRSASASTSNAGSSTASNKRARVVEAANSNSD